MKNLIIINGAAGTGKSTTSKLLLEMLPNSVFLDGDWCWYSSPLKVSDEIITMAMKNMAFVLNNQLHCSAYENVILGWTFHKEDMVENVLSMIDYKDYTLHRFTLTCSENTLISRLQRDIDTGARKNVGWAHAILTRPNFEKLNTTKIITDEITAVQAAYAMYKIIDPYKQFL